MGYTGYMGYMGYLGYVGYVGYMLLSPNILDLQHHFCHTGTNCGKKKGLPPFVFGKHKTYWEKRWDNELWSKHQFMAVYGENGGSES